MWRIKREVKMRGGEGELAGVSAAAVVAVVDALIKKHLVKQMNL